MIDLHPADDRDPGEGERRTGSSERLHLVPPLRTPAGAGVGADERPAAGAGRLSARLGRAPGKEVADAPPSPASPLAARLGRAPGAAGSRGGDGNGRATASVLAAGVGRPPGASAPVAPGLRTADRATARLPGRAAVAGQPASRPSARPMVAAVFAGGIAAASALVATLASGAVPGRLPQLTMVVEPDTAQERVPVRQVTQTVQLPPGVPAPSGAIVHALPAPRATPRTVIVTTTQSGRPVP